MVTRAEDASAFPHFHRLGLPELATSRPDVVLTELIDLEALLDLSLKLATGSSELFSSRAWHLRSSGVEMVLVLLVAIQTQAAPESLERR